MKNIFKSIAVLFLIFNCFALTAQTKKEQLVGTWTFDYATSIVHSSPDKKEMLDTFTAEVVSNIQQAYENRKLTFDASGNYTQVLQDGRTTIGTWNFLSDKHVLQMTNTAGLLLEAKVMEISVNNLLLTPIEPGESTLLINQWYFTKL